MGRPTGGITKKPPAYSDPCVAWLMTLSKAALCDCVVDLLRGQSGCCDEPVEVDAARERLEAVLRLRGDKSTK